MKHFFKENWFKILGSIFIGFCLLYYFVLLPEQKFNYQMYQDSKSEMAKQNEKYSLQAKQTANENKRAECLSSADLSYYNLMKLNSDSVTGKWNSISSQDYVEGKYKDDKDLCLKEYPINN